MPFYLSFIFSPQLLGMFRVQVSVAQSVAAIFPVNTKVLSSLSEAGYQWIFKNIISLSLRYFYILTIIGLLAALYLHQSSFGLVFFIMPYLAIIMERCMLGMKLRKQLILINVGVSLLQMRSYLLVHTIPQMVLVYAVVFLCIYFLWLTRFSLVLNRWFLLHGAHLLSLL